MTDTDDPATQAKTKKISWRTVLSVGGLTLILFAALGAVSVAGWEYSNSDTFCANACHAVHPEEPYAHQESHHANVACVECHIGRLGTFASVGEKTGHVAHAWMFVVGYERPTSSPSFSGAKDSCEGCHTKEPHRHNVVHSEKRFSSDRRNSEKKLTLTLRLNGREFAAENRRGVNWHSSGDIRFIADDAQKQRIRWVEVVQEDGSTKVYNDVTAPLSVSEVENADKSVMDCSDCHNRAGHPFRNPDELVDAALADGRLSSDLPFVKARVIELLEQDFETEEEARELVTAAWDQYQEDFPGLAEDNPEAWANALEFLEERQEFMVNLMLRSRFLDDEVSWRSFPDNLGHKLDPGCFRCHGGNLQDQAGTPITVNCTNCHSVPLITKRDRIPDYFLALLDMRKPESHMDPSFIAKHMDMVGEECEACHEQTRFGASDRSYCSNSGCHGDVWKHLDLDTLRTSPTEIARLIGMKPLADGQVANDR